VIREGTTIILNRMLRASELAHILTHDFRTPAFHDSIVRDTGSGSLVRYVGVYTIGTEIGPILILEGSGAWCVHRAHLLVPSDLLTYRAERYVLDVTASRAYVQALYAAWGDPQAPDDPGPPTQSTGVRPTD
jgi:hypothetical protein